MKFTQELYGALFQSSQSPMLITDQEGLLLEANLQARKTFNLPDVIQVTYPVSDYLPDLKNPDVLQIMIPTDSTPKVFQVDCTRIQADSGVFLYYSFTDISLRYAMEQNAWSTMAKNAAIIDSVRDGIFTLDPDGRVMSMNVAGEKIFDYYIGEVEGQPISVLIPALTVGDTGSLEQLTDQDGVIGFKAMRKGGEEFDVELSVRRFYLEDQQYYTLAISDISERKAVEIELERHRDNLQEMVDLATKEVRAIVDTAVNGVVTINEFGEILLFNPAAEKMFGWQAEQVIGKNVALLLSGIDEQTHNGFIQRYLATKEARIIGIGREVEACRQDGSVFPAQLAVGYRDMTASGTDDEGGSQHLFVAFITDISKQKEAENELIIAKNTAEQGARAKASFLANMSHEIRTPLNAIIGYSEVVHENPQLDQASQQHVKTILRSGKNLLGLINDILDFSKIEAGAILLEQVCFSLPDLISETINTLQFRAEEKDLQLYARIDPAVSAMVVGDPTRLRQVIINLVGNAIKFTEQGYVCIRVTLGGGAHELHFCVEDTGIGMVPEQVKRVFEAFSQAEASTNRRYGGTGLGTTISKQIVELMHGKIWIESEAGKGSQFHFIIPLPQAKEADLELYEHPDALQQAYCSQRCFNVLLAEDLPTNAELAMLRLKQQGHSVTWVEDGEKAARMAIQNDFDLVLMDVQMPQMDGLEASRLIRLYEEINHLADPVSAQDSYRIPVIALTASILREDRQNCLDVGMDEIVGKPIDFSELFQVMDRVVPAGRGTVKVLSTAQATDTVPDDAQEPAFSADSGSSEALLAELGDCIDYRRGLSTWGDADIYLRSLRTFARQRSGDGHQLLALLQSSGPQLESAERLAHALKGLAGNLFIRQVAALSRELDDLIRAGDIVAAIAVCQDLVLQLDRLCYSLARLPDSETQFSDEEKGASLTDGTVPQLSHLSVQHREQLFNALIDAADELNPDAVLPLLEQLKEICSAQCYNRLLACCDRFDFDALKQEIEQLKQTFQTLCPEDRY